MGKKEYIAVMNSFFFPLGSSQKYHKYEEKWGENKKFNKTFL